MRPVTLTIRRLLLVHQVEGVAPWSLGQVQGLSYLGQRPPQTFSVADSLAGLQSEALKQTRG